MGLSDLATGLAGRVLVIVFGLPFLVAGIGLVGVAAAGPGTALYETQTAKTTNGTVGPSEVVERTNANGETRYYARVTYVYTVDGETMTGRRVFYSSPVANETGAPPGKGFETRAEAQAIVNQYSTGDTVTVYYNDPSRPYLRRPNPNLIVGAIMFAVGLPLTVIGGLFVHNGFRRG